MFKKGKKKTLACFFQAVFFREKSFFPKKKPCFFRVATLHGSQRLKGGATKVSENLD